MAMAFSNIQPRQIPIHKTQLHPRMHNNNNNNNNKSPPKSHQKPILLFIILSLALLPFTLFLLSLHRTLHRQIPPSATYALLIHISPSSSLIRVFRSLNEVSATPFSGETSHSMWAQPGSNGSDPKEVGRALGRLVGFAKEKVPGFQWRGTKVRVFVTGDDGDRVLGECRRVLRSSEFLFRDDWASVLEGQDEGLYSWVAVNYALGYIGNKPLETAGVIVLGRSSMQVFYASTESPMSKFSRVVKLAGVSYNLYAQSLQQFGQDAIWNSLLQKDSRDLMSSTQTKELTVSNPCFPRGFEFSLHASDERHMRSHAAGNFSACKSELMTVLNGRQGANCEFSRCEQSPSILNELERKPHPGQKFFLSSQFQGLVPKASVSKLEAAGNHFCEDHLEILKKQYNIDDIDLSRSCFSHAFMALLFQHSFGIPFDDKRVEFAAGSTPVDWKLGAFLTQNIMETLENEVEDQETQIIGNESITYLLFAVLVFVLLAAFFVVKLRKAQLKTIYDLEKGCYIVTRVTR